VNEKFDDSDTVVGGWGGHEVTVLVMTARDVGAVSVDMHATCGGALDKAVDAYRVERQATPGFLSDEEERAGEERFRLSLKRYKKASAGLIQFHLETRRVHP